jgi:hypothetical protein
MATGKKGLGFAIMDRKVEMYYSDTLVQMNLVCVVFFADARGTLFVCHLDVKYGGW